MICTFYTRGKLMTDCRFKAQPRRVDALIYHYFRWVIDYHYLMINGRVDLQMPFIL